MGIFNAKLRRRSVVPAVGQSNVHGFAKLICDTENFEPKKLKLNQSYNCSNKSRYLRDEVATFI